MSEAAAAQATAPTEPQGAPPVIDDEAAQLAELREGLSPSPRSLASDSDPINTDAEEQAPAEGDEAKDPEAKPAEPEKPKESPPRLLAKALEIQDKANAKMDEAKRVLASVEAREAKIQEREAKLAEREKGDLAIGDAIRKDPHSAFGRLGFSPHDLARWCMEEEPQRESRLRDEQRSKADTEAEQRIKALEAKLEEQENQRAAQIEADSKARFASFIERHADDYPEISLEDGSDLGAVFWDLADQHYKATKQVPTFEMVAQHLERAAAQRRAMREERLKKRSSPLAGASSSESQTPRQNGQPASPGPRSPKTLSNAAATERASGPRELSQEELDRECLNELKGVWK